MGAPPDDGGPPGDPKPPNIVDLRGPGPADGEGEGYGFIPCAEAPLMPADAGGPGGIPRGLDALFEEGRCGTEA